MASWYGPKFHGNPTASGEIYNMYALTAAHRTLPLHTRIRVQNLKNGKKLEVRINDRGPFVKNRILDLSYAAAKKLDMIGPGTAPVQIVVLSENPQNPTQKYYIQTGSFTEKRNARNKYDQLHKRGYENSRILKVKINGKKYWRVQAGAFHALQEAKKALQNLSRENPHSFIVAD
jgi:rare lipoprotein A